MLLLKENLWSPEGPAYTYGEHDDDDDDDGDIDDDVDIDDDDDDDDDDNDDDEHLPANTGLLQFPSQSVNLFSLPPTFLGDQSQVSSNLSCKVPRKLTGSSTPGAASPNVGANLQALQPGCFTHTPLPLTGTILLRETLRSYGTIVSHETLVLCGTSYSSTVQQRPCPRFTPVVHLQVIPNIIMTSGLISTTGHLLSSSALLPKSSLTVRSK